MKTLVTRHPLASFMILAFVFALIPFVALSRFLMVRAITVGFAPLLAALLVTAIMEGETGVHRFLRGFLKWRLGAVHYSVVLVLPGLVLLGAWLGLVFFGVDADFVLPDSSTLVLFVFLGLLRSSLGEEAGFRGFAMPLLMQRHSLVPASLMAGGLSALWRLPFAALAGLSLFAGEPARLALFFAGTLIGTTALGIPLGWLYVRTESLIAPILLHLGVGLVFLFLIAPEDVKVIAFAAAFTLVAAVWFGVMRVPLPATAAARPRLAPGPFVAFQVLALVSLAPWFFFWILFNINNPVAERDVSFVIQFLFGTMWQLPVFLLLASTSMWVAFILRFRRAAFAAGAMLCLPLVAFGLILLLQFVEYSRLTS